VQFEGCGPQDQAPVEATRRPDVLTFTSPKLTAPLAVTGQLVATLYVSSNCTDTGAWRGRLCTSL